MGKKVYDNGIKKIRDFDLTPVYHTYEEYFSEFDRFRIILYINFQIYVRKRLQKLKMLTEKEFHCPDSLTVR